VPDSYKKTKELTTFLGGHITQVEQEKKGATDNEAGPLQRGGGTEPIQLLRTECRRFAEEL